LIERRIRSDAARLRSNPVRARLIASIARADLRLTRRLLHPLSGAKEASMSIFFSKVHVVPSTDAGSGGMPFQAHAPHPGFALVGLHLRAGDWIDQITPMFAEMLEDGSLGPEIFGPTFGGMGGAPQQLRVSPGHVVSGMQTRSGNFIDGIRLFESRWDGARLVEAGWTPWVMGGQRGGVERPERFAEPNGSALVIGIAGRAAGYVDNLTLVTGEVLRIASSTLGTTTSGRGSKSSGAQAMG
jgi:hypothetical protein